MNFWVNDYTTDGNSAVVGIQYRGRVLLLHNDDKVIFVALIPNTMRIKCNGSGIIVVIQERWVFLVRHRIDVHLWNIIVFVIF
jgi:hypothetical protein